MTSFPSPFLTYRVHLNGMYCNKVSAFGLEALINPRMVIRWFYYSFFTARECLCRVTRRLNYVTFARYLKELSALTQTLPKAELGN